MTSFERLRRVFTRGGLTERRAVPRTDEPKNALILVVDDSPTVCAVISKMLNQNGHLVLKASSGEAAIDIARSEQPDLIFLDIVMPGMSGFDALRELRRDPLTRDIPIVMISGNVQATEQFYVQRYGADELMKKPFGRREVSSRIRDLGLSGRMTVRERAITGSVPTEEAMVEVTGIPDFALPDPEHLLAPHDPKD